MPDRKVHLACSYMYARKNDLPLHNGAAEAVNTIIDHPARARGLIRRAAKKLCEKKPETYGCVYLRARLDWGFRLKGVLTHDWQSVQGYRLLKTIVREIFGEEYVWLVDLHYALDCIEQGGKICAYAPASMLDWSFVNCQHLVRRNPSIREYETK